VHIFEGTVKFHTAIFSKPYRSEKIKKMVRDGHQTQMVKFLCEKGFKSGAHTAKSFIFAPNRKTMWRHLSIPHRCHVVLFLPATVEFVRAK